MLFAVPLVSKSNNLAATSSMFAFNSATPTLSVENKTEAYNITSEQEEPSIDTQKQDKKSYYLGLI